MENSHDPRVFLASERTLLAWVRTGIAVIALGFVVAKFGLFLAATGAPGSDSHIRSTTIGIALVLLGGLSLALAAVQHQRLCRTLKPEELPRNYSFRFAPWFAMMLTAVSIVLAVHLLLRAAEHEQAISNPDSPALRSFWRPHQQNP
jgi:putative membrane protein